MSWRKRKPSTPSANNRLRRLNGKPVTYRELNNCSRSRRRGLRNLSDWSRGKGWLLTSPLKTHLLKRLTSKFKSFWIKSKRRRALWLLNFRKKNKFIKSLRLSKTNTKQRNNPFWVLRLRSRMILRIYKLWSLSWGTKSTPWIPRSSSIS